MPNGLPHSRLAESSEVQQKRIETALGAYYLSLSAASSLRLPDLSCNQVCPMGLINTLPVIPICGIKSPGCMARPYI